VRADGARLAGTVAAESAPGFDGRPTHYRIDGRVTPPDGRRLDLTLFATAPEPGDFRVLVLADGRMNGAGKTRRTGSQEFVCSNVDL
jgi:hypothetical protein